MTKKVYIVLFALCSLLAWLPAKAQVAAKIGYTNADAILSALPEAKKIETELKTYQDQIAAEYDKKRKDLETKYGEYLKQVQGGNLAPSVREAKEKELQALQQGIQEFQEKAQQDIQSKQSSLLAPVYDKIQTAIDEVAKAEGFDIVLSSDASGFPILLYAKEELDITNKVITKLGGTPIDKKATTNTPATTKPAPKTGN